METTTIKTPTQTAIDKAWNNAERDAALYTVTLCEVFVGSGTVRAMDGHSRYTVIRPGFDNFPFGYCSCPYYEGCGTCKHVALAEAEAMLQQQEAEYEAAEDARAFMAYVAADHAAANRITYNENDLA